MNPSFIRTLCYCLIPLVLSLFACNNGTTTGNDNDNNSINNIINTNNKTNKVVKLKVIVSSTPEFKAALSKRITCDHLNLRKVATDTSILGDGEFVSFTPTSVKLGIESIWLQGNGRELMVPINQEVELANGDSALNDLIQKNTILSMKDTGTYTSVHVQTTNEGKLTIGGTVSIRGRTYTFSDLSSGIGMGSFTYNIPEIAKKVYISAIDTSIVDTSSMPVIRLIFDTQDMVMLTGNQNGGTPLQGDSVTRLWFENAIVVVYVGNNAPVVEKYRLNIAGDSINYLKLFVVRDPDGIVVGYGWNTVYTGGLSMEGFMAPGKTGSCELIKQNSDGSYYFGKDTTCLKPGTLWGYLDAFRLENHSGTLHCVGNIGEQNEKCKDWIYNAVKLSGE